jgi:hypothetical protein
VTQHLAIRRSVTLTLGALLAAAVFLAALLPALAGRAGAEVGASIQLTNDCSVVSLQTQDGDASFVSLYLWYDGTNQLLGVSTNDAPTSVEIPQQFGPGELILGIRVLSSNPVHHDKFYYTGTGPNSDGLPHADVTGGGSSYTVGFEDSYQYLIDEDYNDAIIEVTVEPCPVTDVELIVNVDPASTGTGSVLGSGTYALGSTALAQAIPGPGSSFVAWSGHCSGGSPAVNVLMDADKVCNALFEAVPVPTPTATPSPTPPPPIPTPEVAGASIGIDNTRTSPSPANLGDQVVFRIDVELTDVPATNEAEVLITFDDGFLQYDSDSTGACALYSIGIVCDFGVAASGFSFDLNFTALQTTASTATHATLGADFDGAGPAGLTTAGPASADVAIVDVAGIQLPPLGDGSASSAQANATPLAAAGLVILLGASAGTTLGAVRRRSP